MTNETIISVQADSRGHIVATDEATGIQAKGSNRSLALTTLAQKLEMNHPESARERPNSEGRRP